MVKTIYGYMLKPTIHLVKKDNQLTLEIHTVKDDIFCLLSKDKMKKLRQALTDCLENNSDSPTWAEIEIPFTSNF